MSPATAGIGALDQLFTLESPSRTSDGGGGAAIAWVTVADVWATVHPITGEERLRADQVAGRVTHAVTMRHRGDVTPAMRLRSGSRVLEIAAVLAAPRALRLRCLCEERYL